jgi:WD40 repeat protein
VWQCSSESQTWSCIAVLYGHWDSVRDVAFLPDGKRIVSQSDDNTIRIWDISAVIEGREFEVEMDEGMPAVMGSWFRHAIPLGGWYNGVPFVFQHRFKLPAGVEPLDWDIVAEEGSDSEVKSDERDSPTQEDGKNNVATDIQADRDEDGSVNSDNA